jgi:hypothetical protein
MPVQGPDTRAIIHQNAPCRQGATYLKSDEAGEIVMLYTAMVQTKRGLCLASFIIIPHLARNIESQSPLDLSYPLLRQGPDATRPADGALRSKRATGAAIIATAG